MVWQGYLLLRQQGALSVAWRAFGWHLNIYFLVLHPRTDLMPGSGRGGRPLHGGVNLYRGSNYTALSKVIINNVNGMLWWILCLPATEMVEFRSFGRGSPRLSGQIDPLQNEFGLWTYGLVNHFQFGNGYRKVCSGYEAYGLNPGLMWSGCI